MCCIVLVHSDEACYTACHFVEEQVLVVVSTVFTTYTGRYRVACCTNATSLASYAVLQILQRAQETRSALRQQVESGATLRDDHRFLRVMGVDSSEVSCVHAVTDAIKLVVFPSYSAQSVLTASTHHSVLYGVGSN
jgi:hypothetical protein